MKYRIKHYRDGNSAGYYEAEFELMSLFGLTWWTTFDGGQRDCSWPKHFPSIEAAEKEVVQYLRTKLNTTVVRSAVVAQGTVTGYTT